MTGATRLWRVHAGAAGLASRGPCAHICLAKWFDLLQQFPVEGATDADSWGVATLRQQGQPHTLEARSDTCTWAASRPPCTLARLLLGRASSKVVPPSYRGAPYPSLQAMMSINCVLVEVHRGQLLLCHAAVFVHRGARIVGQSTGMPVAQIVFSFT